MDNKNFSLVCTSYGQQVKNISHFCGQSISKEAKCIIPIKINTGTEATIKEPKYIIIQNHSNLLILMNFLILKIFFHMFLL